MNKILIADNNLISVWIYPERGMLHSQMKSYVFGPEYREGLTKTIEAMGSYRVTKWIADNRAHSAVPPDDLDWTFKTWFPRALASGWRHWALVQPISLIGQIRMERVIKTFAEQGLNARMFTDPDEAMRWLDGL